MSIASLETPAAPRGDFTVKALRASATAAILSLVAVAGIMIAAAGPSFTGHVQKGQVLVSATDVLYGQG